MAWVKTIEPEVGEVTTSKSTIETYITLLKAGLTKVDVNGKLFPIGYFNENEMELYTKVINMANNVWLYYINDIDHILPSHRDSKIKENKEKILSMTDGIIDLLFDEHHSVMEIPDFLRDLVLIRGFHL